MGSPEFPGSLHTSRTLNGEKAAKTESAGDALPTPEGETWKRVIVVSNRLPFKVLYDSEGKPNVLASSGGLVTAMSPLLREGVAGKWIGWPGTEEEEGLEEALRSQSEGQFDVGIVPLTKEEEQYYRGYSNEVLCPLLGGETDKVDFAKEQAYWPAYQNVQKKFAEKIREDVRAGDIIWVHDYHLAGVGKELNALGVKQPVGYFLHMPFPEKEQFGLLPHRREFLEDLLAYDIVGFQTGKFKQNFIRTVAEYIPEAVIEQSSGDITVVRMGERTVRLGNFPISIDTEEFSGQLEAPDTQANVQRLTSALKNMNDSQLIFNIGRLDYTKGFEEELLAFDRLLEKHPELVGKLILYQLVVPSRETIGAYKEYKEKITGLAKSINQKYRSSIVQDVTEGDGDSFERYPGMPVRQIHGHMGRPRYLAHLNTADIQSIPTRSDGMNLVAKESAVVGKSTTVQILGRAAGAAEELGDYVLLIDPQNIESFADTMYRAYTMAESEKRERKVWMADTVKANDVFSWWSQAQEPVFQEVWDEKTLK